MSFETAYSQSVWGGFLFNSHNTTKDSVVTFSAGAIRSWFAANLKSFSAVQDAVASVGSGSGTNAGNVATITGATGGATSANSGTVSGGTGGKIIVTGGNGGAITGAPATGFGGTGGEISFTAGDGGTGTTFGGGGGNANVQAGNGGNGTTPGSGGYAALKAGNGSSSGNSSGGNVFLVGGAKTGGGQDGDIYLGVSPSFTSRGKIKVGGSTSPAALVTIGEEGAKLGTLSMAGSTSGTVTLQPAAAAGTYTLTLPNTDGASGEFLQTDGSGALTWAAASGSGTVTDVSVVTANGFAGTVATSTTTPAITLTTSVTGLLKGNGTSVSAAVNSDLPTMTATVGGAVPTPPNNTTTFLRGDGTFATPAGGGDVATDPIWDAKGDLAVGTGANTAIRLVVGTDGKQIYADADESTGLRWGPYVITPAQISADEDDYNPTGWDECQIVRLNADAFRAITSVVATFSGDQKTLFNEGAYPIYFPGEHPDGTASNRFITQKDYILLPGESVDIWYDGTSSRWRFKGYKADVLDYKGLSYNKSPGSVTAGDWGDLTLVNSGTGAVISGTDAVSGYPGCWTFSTGTTATGGNYIYLPKVISQMAIYGDAHISTQAVLSLPTLSDGTDRFLVDLSINDAPTTSQTTGAANNNTIGIRYIDNVNSGKWQGYSKDNAGTETSVDLGVVVSTATLYILRVEIDKSRSEARYYVNGVMCGRIAANIPNANTCGPKMWLQKTVGTTARTVKIHKFMFHSIYP